MRIGVNARLLIKDKLDGMGWFTYEVVRRMVANHPEVEFVMFFDRTWHPDFEFGPNAKNVKLAPQARHPILFHWWFNYSITKALKKHQCDLFFSPDGYMSLRTKKPQLAVFHDLNFEHHPEYLPKHIVKFYQTSFPKYAAAASHIITVSDFTKEDVIQQYGVDRKKVTTVYNGFHNSFTGTRSAANQIVGDTPYFVCVGSLHPRKNVARIITAFDSFRKRHKEAVKLVFAGAKMWWTDDMEKALKKANHSKDILFTGRLGQNEMAAIVQGAKAMVYPSIFEGFGLPILEGFAAKIPVITSDTSSMPEIADNAAILVDPTMTEQIEEAMVKVIDVTVANKLVEAGNNRLSYFSWDKTAQGVWQVINDQFLAR